MTIRSYIIVRKDLTPSQQAVQAAHAAQEVGFRSDLPESPVHLVLLGVKDAQEFSQIIRKLSKAKIQFELFYEPDDDMGHTALCTYPAEGYIKELGSLKLL